MHKKYIRTGGEDGSEWRVESGEWRAEGGEWGEWRVKS